MIQSLISLSESTIEKRRLEETSEERHSEHEYNGFDTQASHDVQMLARKFTHESNAGNDGEMLEKYLTNMSDVPGINPYTDELYTHDQLDPNSDNFSAKFWIKNLRKLYDSDPEYYKPSRLGVAYRDLRAYGVANDSDYQPTVANALWKLITEGVNYLKRKEDDSRYFDILKPMDGIVKPGKLTVVLGRPGGGCSTLLKTLAAQPYGFHVATESKISYDGLTPKDIEKNYRGNVIYSAETDIHFPHLSVGQVLEFAARMRTPQNRGEGVDRETYAKHMASVYMASYGLLHTRNTNVGNDFVRGVSGGERKRVSIAEVSLSGANVQCWDNATRGLDAATALEFIRALKTSAVILESTPLIAIYQCSQDAYDLFDNVVVLYEGYQIFFGKADRAKEYFVNMGYKCPQRQTTADFLTSLTNPAEREPLPGYEKKVPRTAQEFEAYWKKSPEYAALIDDIDNYFFECEKLNTKQVYHDAHVARQSNHIRPTSPYTVSFFMQVKYVMHRNFQRMRADPSIPIATIFSQLVMGLLLASVFYKLRKDTSTFYFRSGSLYFSLVFNAISSILEILALFEAREIVEKHKKYALYRPSADALASVISELPVKFFQSLCFNIPFYFMVDLRRNAGRFFFYWLIGLTCTVVISHIFRSIGAVSTTVSGAMTPATVILIGLILYAGFVIPFPNMLGWSKWIKWINPVSYMFESLMVNEYHDREFPCGQFIPEGPGYDNLPIDNKVCAAVGAVPGSAVVQGDDYMRITFDFYNAHKWRNFGIAVGYGVFFLFVYVVLTELNKGAIQKGEITLFLRGSLKKHRRRNAAAPKPRDIESGTLDMINLHDKFQGSRAQEISEDATAGSIDISDKKEIFFWKDLTYQVKIKKEDRVILDHVDGWVKPGQITALMGASGAGKTTLLNCLSERVTTGVITDGERLVNGHALDSSFQRSIGYVQQQDIHLQTSTVREALQFSAYLRQSRKISKKEKDEYVDYVIDLLEMTDYADALVGVAGEGLNVEQRKRLTIGVELVAKPKLLLFLDEPTSGLDSQTAWSICKLMRKLADHGQAILCTIHQPSALIMTEFDRLLFLQKGGQTVYFGGLGENCQTMIDYFEKHGADPCPKDANPAEWMLEVVGAAPGSHAKQNYFEVWRSSDEYKAVRNEISRMETELVKLPRSEDPEVLLRYAAPVWKQYLLVSWRAIVQDWRSPGYIYSKLFLVIASSIFIGFSFFKAKNDVQGLTNQMLAVFMYTVPLTTIIDQLLPFFVRQREVFEVREAPSRTYSWVAFIAAQITSEIPYQVLVGTLSFLCWYYPVGLYANAEPTNTVNSRGTLMWMFLTSFYVYAATFGQLCMSFTELIDAAGNIASTLYIMCLMFCGVIVLPSVMPGFWIFMYRINPFTYLILGILATGLGNNKVACAKREFVTLQPPRGLTCSTFLNPYIRAAGGYYYSLENGSCSFCLMDSTDQFLEIANSPYNRRWKNFGIFVAFIGINVIFTIFLYWLFRVPKRFNLRLVKK
ncbi:Multidrug resistance protein CDR2 [Candida viswanathii]|uniref:Multidrug resistance protein CDR2 n=1 Tax=Candida viswanathii TaxID=5486 RepID=A0A367YEP8_9ASCO|nr:Multidrug resistance protein CDR2 [Candida viswanathii]